MGIRDDCCAQINIRIWIPSITSRQTDFVLFIELLWLFGEFLLSEESYSVSNDTIIVIYVGISIIYSTNRAFRLCGQRRGWCAVRCVTYARCTGVIRPDTTGSFMCVALLYPTTTYSNRAFGRLGATLLRQVVHRESSLPLPLLPTKRHTSPHSSSPGHRLTCQTRQESADTMQWQ